jgi:hypothetical protein
MRPRNASPWRILQAMAKGETDPEKLAALGGDRLQCGRAVLADALTGSTNEIHRTLPRQHLDCTALLDWQIEELNRLCAAHIQAHQDVVVRLITGAGSAPRRRRRFLPIPDRQRLHSRHPSGSPPGACAYYPSSRGSLSLAFFRHDGIGA